MSLIESKSKVEFDSFDSFIESIGDHASSQCRHSFSPQRIARGLCTDVQLLLEDTFSLRIAAFLDDAEIHETHFLAVAAESASMERVARGDSRWRRINCAREQTQCL
jgi:hypothetical protein